MNNKYGRWFFWAVFAGILQDWFFALPGIFYPNTVLGLAQTEPAIQPIWPAYACIPRPGIVTRIARAGNGYRHDKCVRICGRSLQPDCRSGAGAPENASR